MRKISSIILSLVIMICGSINVNSSENDNIVSVIGEDEINGFIDSEDNIYELTREEYDFICKTIRSNKGDKFIQSCISDLNHLNCVIINNLGLFWKEINKLLNKSNSLKTILENNITFIRPDNINKSIRIPVQYLIYRYSRNIRYLYYYTIFPIYFITLFKYGCIPLSNTTLLNVCNNIAQKISNKDINNVLHNYINKYKDYLKDIIDLVKYLHASFNVVNTNPKESNDKLTSILIEKLCSMKMFYISLEDIASIKTYLNNDNNKSILNQYTKVLEKYKSILEDDLSKYDNMPDIVNKCNILLKIIFKR